MAPVEFIFLAVIEFPGRAMFQIISPLVAKAINENDYATLLNLLKKSANNLLLISGLLFLLINLNLNDFYAWVNLGDYTVALEVVLIVSLGKLFTMSMGCLNHIITNSKYYVYVFWFSLISALLAVFLNLFLIECYGIIGASYATLMVMILINVLKILLVQKRFRMNPFSKKTFLTLVVIVFLYWIISMISFDYEPFLSLLLRSTLIVIAFTFLSYLLKLTVDVQKFINKVLPTINKI